MNQNRIEDRAIAAYLGLAIGDSLGATVEFMTPREILFEYGLHDEMIGGGWLKLPVGQVTDDTTMSFALGRSIIKESGVAPVSVAKSFNQWMRDNPVDIGHTVRRGIVHYRYSGIPVAPESEAGAGNGACMRTLPIALYALFLDETTVRLASRNQAHVTHNNALSDAGTECVVFMLRDAILGASKHSLLNKHVTPLINKFPEFEFKHQKRENPSGFIVETLQAVFQAFFNSTNFEKSMIDVINRGGDSDTTGAILGMLCGAYYGLSSVPNKWLEKLNSEVRQECEQQATQLLELALSLRNQLLKTENKVANG